MLTIRQTPSLDGKAGKLSATCDMDGLDHFFEVVHWWKSLKWRVYDEEGKQIFYGSFPQGRLQALATAAGHNSIHLEAVGLNWMGEAEYWNGLKAFYGEHFNINNLPENILLPWRDEHGVPVYDGEWFIPANSPWTMGKEWAKRHPEAIFA